MPESTSSALNHPRCRGKPCDRAAGPRASVGRTQISRPAAKAIAVRNHSLQLTETKPRILRQHRQVSVARCAAKAGPAPFSRSGVINGRCYDTATGLFRLVMTISSPRPTRNSERTAARTIAEFSQARKRSCNFALTQRSDHFSADKDCRLRARRVRSP